jgi:hypothetical protein
MQTMIEDGYSIEEVDKINGTGRPADPRQRRFARSIW